MNAKLIIEKNIRDLKQLNKDDFNSSLCNAILGKIMLAVELTLIEWGEAEKYIDEVLK